MAVEALDLALEMAPAERAARGRKDLAHVTSNTMEEWARRFAVDLKCRFRDTNRVGVLPGARSEGARSLGARTLGARQPVDAMQLLVRA